MALTDYQYPYHSSAKIIPPFAGIAVLLNVGPLIWHVRNRNVGAASIISWIVILNLINFCNSLIWPRDNIHQWWDGKIYCDIQLRLIVGGTLGGITGGTLCLAKSLAKVLDTKSQVISHDKGDRRRKYVLEGLLCIGLPIWFMIVLYFVQVGRYYIEGVWGCDVPMSRSWPTIALLRIWPVLLMLIASYYAGWFFS